MVDSQGAAGQFERPISALNLSRPLKAALIEAGYKTLADIKQVSASDLSTELSVSLAQAEELLHQVDTLQAGPSEPNKLSSSQHRPIQHSQIQSSTAADLLSTASLPHFSTFSTSLDTLISRFSDADRDTRDGISSRKGKEKEDTGAIFPGMTVEISGPPGGGKTAVALGILLNARMARIGGVNGLGQEGEADRETDDQLGGEVLVLDTEGAITAERVYRAAEIVKRSSSIPPKQILHGIHIVRVLTQVEMIAFLHTLDDWLETHPKVNLVVIDTLSYHFRQPGLDMGTRRRIMELAKQKIGQATTVHRCAVVVCNQLATKLLTAENKPANFDTGDRAVLMPQLGDSWTTGKTLRIVLFRGGPGDELRYAHASVSGSNKDVPWACFDIDIDGIPCDVPDSLFRAITPPILDEDEVD
ncbi:hypothetical protein CI109_101611 [Kwoniella shandongensis]|uniref:Uncharacterized protein n=1 Tax=Kwoniella shandongensis TaxID=1734106 RepID=A0A5M6C6L5_9TREE|nr:uncharacterized protein CI109_001264 [Kwoniella shandongensis]KAA5530461.1 hypothetical protein CI109_001264 [Kwoniella shandongensis]